MAIRRITVLTDFSACSDRAVAVGLELARALGARLLLLNLYPEVRGGRAPLGSAGLDPELREEALAAMKKQLAGHDADGVEVELHVELGLVSDGSTLAALKKTTPDLVVMGTHGRTGLKHALLGSIAELCVRKAPCPVLTVKAD